jgi:hypothetical protein
MADVTNYWPDPDFRTSTRDGIVNFNVFPNPTPTVDLTHWAAVSGGSITRTADAALFPENGYGCRVVNGVTLTGANTVSPGQDWNFTGKIRASEAMTITMSGAMLTAGQTFSIRLAGWGSFGWGEEVTWEEGASKAFEADEECLFRIYCGESSSVVGPVHQVLLTLSGTGTFDVDGITQTVGVDDGFGDDDPYQLIPDAPLFFSGDFPDDENFTYSWYGTPHDSPSLQQAAVPKYAGNTTYDYYWSEEAPFTPDSAFRYTAPDEESRLALRSPIMFGANPLFLSDGTNPDIRGLDLAPGNYVVSFDYVQDYTSYFYGYEEPDWGSNCYFSIYDRDPALSYPANRLQYMPLNGFTPYRKRFSAPFTVTSTSRIEIQWDAPLNWLTGDIYVTNVAINSVENIYHHYDGLDLEASGNYDLMALGVEAGKSYHINVEYYDPCVGTVEYKVGAGSWTTLAESYIGAQTEPDYALGDYYAFTVPADATEVRLSLSDPAMNIGTFDLFDAPPEFFDGDTPDGGGYTYAWSGTPYESASIRSDAAASSINAKVFVGGTAITVTEMRAVVGGTLIPITEAGA